MSKTLIAVNTLTAISSQAYASHINLAFRMAKDCPEDEFMLFNGYRTSIDNFRNRAGKLALEQECDYLLFLDDDVLVDPHTYRKLKDRNVDIITPITFIRSYPFKPMFFKSILSDDGQVCGLTHYSGWEEAPKTDGLLEVAAIGFSCCLLKVELLRKVAPAWFVTGAGHTEDVYFCVKARQSLENKVGIYVDCTFGTGHMLDAEFVAPVTVEALRHFYEELDPSLKLAKTRGDNTNDYLERQKEALERMQEQITTLEAHNKVVASEA